MKEIKIGDRVIKPDAPVFCIAEIGINHNGDIELAKKMVEAAAESGASAIKFQYFSVENLVIKEADYYGGMEVVSQFEMFKKTELTIEDYKELFKLAKGLNVLAFCSVFDEEKVDILHDLGVPAFKIASGDITHIPLLKYVARKGLPIFLSTGMSTLHEVKEAVEAIESQGNDQIVLLHCVNNYPARVEDTHLLKMKSLKDHFDYPVGISDHADTIYTALGAVALGGLVIEKHFTVDRNIYGVDNYFSLEPQMFKEMVNGAEAIRVALGSPAKEPAESEAESRKLQRRSLVSKTEILKGTRITKDMITIKRPGTGIYPKYLNDVYGKKAKTNIKKDVVITWDILE